MLWEEGGDRLVQGSRIKIDRSSVPYLPIHRADNGTLKVLLTPTFFNIYGIEFNA